MIRLHDIEIGYPSRQLLSGVNAEIRAGRLTALLGRNGSGKSTLLRAVAGLERPVAGEILCDGRNIFDMSPGERAATVSFVTTSRIRIANMRCHDLVALGRAPYTDWLGRLSEADEARVAESLALTGMADYAQRTLDTMSDGECQRVMIARALAQDTPVILLDEPTSFLDLPNRYELCLLLRRLAHEQGKCILCSTHELDIALNICDDIALIDSPHLHVASADETAASGSLRRLFSNASFSFDPLAMVNVGKNL